MGESLKSLFRRGLVSAKQYPKILGQTKHQKSKMADFDDKKGRRDQGGVHDKGDNSIASTRAIDQNQRAGSPIGGKPSKGGGAGAPDEPHGGEIDAAATQKPNWPTGSKVKGGNAKRKVGVSGPAGKSSGGSYGGPNSRANG